MVPCSTSPLEPGDQVDRSDCNDCNDCSSCEVPPRDGLVSVARSPLPYTAPIAAAAAAAAAEVDDGGVRCDDGAVTVVVVARWGDCVGDTCATRPGYGGDDVVLWELLCRNDAVDAGCVDERVESSKSREGDTGTSG